MQGSDVAAHASTLAQTGRRGVFVGLATVDIIHRVARPVGVNQKVTALSQEIVAGGPAANAAVTFALLGGEAVLITDLGSHPLAELARKDLSAYGVAVRPVEPDSPAAPAVSSIRVLDGTGDRSVVSVNAAARTVAAPDWLPAVIDDAGVLLLDGHHPALALSAARAARDRGLPVLLDAGSWKPVLDDLLSLVDVAICSADLRVPGAVDVMTALPARGVRGVAVSHGGGSVRWSADGELGDVPVPHVEIRDTLGAGDVLHGAFAWELTHDDDTFDRRLARAVAVASHRCTFTGISSWRNHLLRRAGG